jgi:hypothetical protein
MSNTCATAPSKQCVNYRTTLRRQQSHPRNARNTKPRRQPHRATVPSKQSKEHKTARRRQPHRATVPSKQSKEHRTARRGTLDSHRHHGPRTGQHRLSTVLQAASHSNYTVCRQRSIDRASKRTGTMYEPAQTTCVYSATGCIIGVPTQLGGMGGKTVPKNSTQVDTMVMTIRTCSKINHLGNKGWHILEAKMDTSSTIKQNAHIQYSPSNPHQ